MNILNGKKIIFVGNSFTYYGKCVLDKGRKNLELAPRQNDKGYFYQICKANGAEVSVTNWTWGGHALHDTFGGKCGYRRECTGADHFAYLTDLKYDYVVIQEGSRNLGAADSLEWYKKIMRIFRNENPDVKFIFPLHIGFYVLAPKYADIFKSIDEFEKLGMPIVSWGTLVNDIMTGKVEVPGATQKYNKNSFVISQSEADGFHQNMLSGYITALMIYCAITGESAVGQDYSFCGDTGVNEEFSFKNYCDMYYCYNGAKTNFPQIFESESDMKGIQQLIDKYLKEKMY